MSNFEEDIKRLRNMNLIVAQFAIDYVADFKRNSIQDELNTKCSSAKDKQDKFKTVVKKIPTLIQNNGFINTLAFCLSKNKKGNEYEAVMNAIINWSKYNIKINYILQIENDNSSDKYIKYIQKVANLEQRDYRLVSKEIMILFGWLKRFTDGMI